MSSYLSREVSILEGGKFKKCFLSSNGRSNGSSIVLRRGETGWGWNERVKRGRCSFRRGLLTRILLESRGNGIGRMNRVGRTSEIIALPPFRRTYLFTLNNDEWTRGLGSSPDHLYLCFWRDWPETMGQEECVRRGRSIYSLCNSRRTIPVSCPSSVCAKLLLLFRWKCIGMKVNWFVIDADGLFDVIMLYVIGRS